VHNWRYRWWNTKCLKRTRYFRWVVYWIYKVSEFAGSTLLINKTHPWTWSWASSIYFSSSQLTMIHLNVTLLCPSQSSKQVLSLRSHHQNPVCSLNFYHSSYMSSPSYSPRFHYPNKSRWPVQIKMFLICNILNSPLHPS